MESQTMTISALARAAGVPVSTVRFYERRGLIRPDTRSTANYRRYLPTTLERLKLIRTAQDTGLSLKDVKELLALLRPEQDRSPCKDVERVLEARLQEIREQIKKLKRVQRAIQLSLGTACCTGKRPGLCETIIRMNGGKPILRNSC